MAIASSGPLRFSDINIMLGGGSNSPIKMSQISACFNMSTPTTCSSLYGRSNHIPYLSNMLSYIDTTKSSCYSYGSNIVSSIYPSNMKYSICNIGTLSNITTNGVITSNLSFNGTNTYLFSPNYINTFTGDLTMICQYYRLGNASGGSPGQGALLCLNRDSTNYIDCGIFFENSLLTIDKYNTTRMSFTPNTTISGTGWNFRAFSITSSGTNAKAYYNGLPDGSSTITTGGSFKNNAICIGKNYRDNANELNGLMQLHLVYNKVLSDSDILSIYNQNYKMVNGI